MSMSDWVVVPPNVRLTSDGTTSSQSNKQWYRPIIAVILLVHQKPGIRHFLAQFLKSFRAYKYSTLSCMKMHKKVNKSLEILSCKSIKKVLSALLLLVKICNLSKRCVRLVKVVS